jgi:hypothetical protein
MIFQRQGCVLSNDYGELSNVKTKSLYISHRTRVFGVYIRQDMDLSRDSMWANKDLAPIGGGLIGPHMVGQMSLMIRLPPELNHNKRCYKTT